MNASGSYQDLFNTDSSSDLFASLLPNSVVVTDRDTLLQSEPLPDGSILAGTASGVRGKALLGTERQIIVTNDADEIKLALPQDIDTEATPRFSGVRVSDDIDFVFDPSEFNGWQEVRQTIVAAEPYAVNRTWTLPLISDAAFDPAASLTFAALEGRQTFTGPKSFWETIQVNDIVPVSNGSYNLGATDRRFRYLHLGRGSGTIDLGIDNGGRAELKLVSNGSAAQNVTFGESGSPIAEAAWNWRLSGRDSGEGRNLNLYRGPYLTESDPEIVVQCRSDTGQVMFHKNTDSTDNKSGSVRFLGGIGVSKSVHAQHIGAETISATSAITATSVTTDSLTATGAISAASVTTDSLTVTNGITIPGLSANTVVGTDSGGNLQSLTTASNNGVTATVADGVLTVDTPQDLRTTAEPTFPSIMLGTRRMLGSSANIYFDATLASNFSTSNYLGGVTVNARWKGLRLGDGDPGGRGQVNIVCNGTNVNADIGAYDDLVRTQYGRWRIDSRSDTENYEYRLSHAPGGSESGHTRLFSITGAGGNLYQSTFHHALDSSSPTTGSVLFKGGVGIAKTLHAASVNAASSLRVAGTAVTPTNYVTLDGTQTITGAKTFSSTIMPSTSSVNLGSAASPFGQIHANGVTVQRGSGAIDARFTGTQPELFINSDGDGISQISFGSGTANSTNTKWAISSRASGTNNEGLRVYRGPKLAGAWDQILQIDGTGTDAGLVIFNKGDESTSMTSGAVQIRGGLGVSKNLHANNLAAMGGMYFPNGGNARMEYYAEWSENTTFATDGSSMISINPPGTIKCVRVGDTVTVDVTTNAANFLVTSGNPALVAQHALPDIFKPNVKKYGSAIVNNHNNKYSPALVSVNTLGIIVVEPGPHGYFQGSLGSSNNLYGFSISYNLN